MMSVVPDVSTTLNVDSRRELVFWLKRVVTLRPAYPATAEWAFPCVEAVVLDHGRWGGPAQPIDDRDRGAETMCYSNAAGWAAQPGMFYTEGYALDRTGAFLHAWCVDHDGRVYDPTWSGSGGLCYLGLTFTPDYTAAVEARWGWTGILVDAHRDNFRLLRQGLPTDAVLPIGEKASTR